MEQIKNKNGEDLYAVTIVETNDLCCPYVYLYTWENAVEKVRQHCQNIDNDRVRSTCIKCDIDERLHRAEGRTVRNHKGFGGDFFTIIKVEMAFYDE